MADSAEERNREAREAAETLLPNQQGGRTLRNYGGIRRFRDSNVNQRMRRVCCGFISDVRRTFCLLVTFDLILTFVLWGIYVQLKDAKAFIKISDKCQTNNTFAFNFCEEVLVFDVHNSLFDIVICTILRVLCLLLAYGLCRIGNPSVIAVTTFFTSLYIIVKVFLFSFQNCANNPPSYLLLITSFVIAWVETWFLDFRVLPHENSLPSRSADGDRISGGGGGRADERSSLLGGRAGPENPDSNFGTPTGGSDEEDDGRAWDATGSSGEINELQARADEAWRQARDLINLQTGWKREQGVDDILLHSQNYKKLGKTFRIEATINASVSDVFDVAAVRLADMSRWNPTISESKILQKLGDSYDVTYGVTAPAGKGLVSSRDFVTVRHWKPVQNGAIMSAGCAATIPQMPPQPQHVRGENRLSGWYFQPIDNKPDQCLLTIFVSTDIKGWIPQTIVDQALTGVLLESVQHLRRHIAKSSVVIM